MLALLLVAELVFGFVQSVETGFLRILGAQGDPPLGADASGAEGQAEIENAVARFGEVRRQVQGGDPQKGDTGL